MLSKVVTRGWITLLLIISLGTETVYCGECLREYFKDGFVCVCQENGCDSLNPLVLPNIGEYLRVSSSKQSDRFNQSYRKLVQGVKNKEAIVININTKYQELMGFGGALTDSAAIHISSLSKQTKDMLLRSYFSDHGLEYNIVRLPIAGSDFSTRPYSYDDIEGDVDLKNFSLTEEDYFLKIPLLKYIEAISQQNILLFASPWSAPKWMKTNNQFNGLGILKREYYDSWAKYIVRFLEEYQKSGFSFWGLTAQNEPLNGLIPDFPFNCMGWTAYTQLNFIKNYLGPELSMKGFGQVKLMILDDQRFNLPGWANTILSDEEAKRYVSGIAVHWYWDSVPSSLLSLTHDRWPDYFILATEACTGYLDNTVRPGSWDRGEAYALDIIQDLNHWVVGWVDWNIALDITGGPNWANNFVDSPVLVNKTGDKFYKQPMYYVMGHFSKFIPRGSIRVGMEMVGVSPGLQSLVVIRPDGYVVAVVVNTATMENEVRIEDVVNNVTIKDVLSAKSIVTYIWKF